MAAPLSQTAPGTPWLLTILAGGVCTTLCWAVEQYCGEPPQWVKAAQWIPAILLVTASMHWLDLCWPKSDGHIPMILLAVSIWIAGKPEKQIAALGTVLTWLILGLFGMVFFTGFREISPESLGHRWTVPDPVLLAVLLVPAMDRRKVPGAWILGAAFSILVQGVLSGPIPAAPFWELGRSLSLPGTSERFESLIAMGVTLSTCLFQAKLLAGKIWSAGAAAGILYVLGWYPGGEILAVTAITGWVILPLSAELKKYSKNVKKWLTNGN